MKDFRRQAAKMDQYMQELATQGVSDTEIIIDRMMGFVPELHQIWTGTTDEQLKELCVAFPMFYRYAGIMEAASEAERSKGSRPYDGLAEFTEENKQIAAQLLIVGGKLEREYQRMDSRGWEKAAELWRDYQEWEREMESFKRKLREQGVAHQAIAYVSEVFLRMGKRMKELAG